MYWFLLSLNHGANEARNTGGVTTSVVRVIGVNLAVLQQILV
jgi:hypothetical protein